MKTLLIVLTTLMSISSWATETPKYNCKNEASGVSFSFYNGLENWALPYGVQIDISGSKKPLDITQEGATIHRYPADADPSMPSDAEITLKGSILKRNFLGKESVDGTYSLSVIHKREEQQAEGTITLTSKKKNLQLENIEVSCIVNH